VDLRGFFHKIKSIEATIEGEHVIVVSNETPDGGRPGTMTEVSRHNAAKLMAEGRARLATAEESDEFRSAARKAALDAERQANAGRVQMTMLPTSDVEILKSVLGLDK